MHNFKRKLIGAVICSTAMFGMLPATAFAHTGPEAECICETKCEEGAVNDQCPVPCQTCGDLRDLLTADINIPETITLDQETARVMRSRILNPKWLEGLKEHSYKGAQEISKVMDNIFGWDATADNVENWMYEDFANTFLFDEDTLNWIRSVNKNAAYQISERLLEANQRKMWAAKPESLKKLIFGKEGKVVA